VMGQEQQASGFPFLRNLVQHLLFSSQQGLKIQICDFLRQLLEGEQNQLTSSMKEILYREVIGRFVDFFDQLSEFGDISELHEEDDLNSEMSIKYRKMKSLEYSTYLCLQILNKTVAEHRYLFRVHIIQRIPKVTKLVELKSTLINMEIVKFFKAILRSKDAIYLRFIEQRNQFQCISTIFEQTYHPNKPPMIQSCIRDLYEMIFTNKNNDFFCPKFADHLTNTDVKSKEIIANPLYEDVFSKY
jgi:hypothetical protein